MTHGGTDASVGSDPAIELPTSDREIKRIRQALDGDLRRRVTPAHLLLSTIRERSPDAPLMERLDQMERLNAGTSRKVHRYVLAILESRVNDAPGLTRDLAVHVYEILSRHVVSPPEDTEIDLWLEVSGGDVQAAYRIGVSLRSRADFIRVVIPSIARGAGTLLAMVGDEIYMSDVAELGPLDALIEAKDAGAQVSALDTLRSVELVVDASRRIAIELGAELTETAGLDRKEALAASIELSAKLMEPLIGRLDPISILQSESALNAVEKYAENILKGRRQGSGSHESSLPRLLSRGYPSHDFIISAPEAARLGLPIVPLRQYALLEDVLWLCKEARKERRCKVTLFSPDGAEPT